jgi:hypothetical protein
MLSALYSLALLSVPFPAVAGTMNMVGLAYYTCIQSARPRTGLALCVQFRLCPAVTFNALSGPQVALSLRKQVGCLHVSNSFIHSFVLLGADGGACLCPLKPGTRPCKPSCCPSFTHLVLEQPWRLACAGVGLGPGHHHQLHMMSWQGVLAKCA